MAVREELDAFVAKVNSNPVHIANEKDRVFQIELQESGVLQIVLKNGKLSVAEGTPNEPQVTIKTSDKNFSLLLKDDLNTTMAFMTGGLKIDGNIGLAMKLQEIVKKYQ
ncbi:SCP2 sterol-binding domain-containing protein [Robertmurraya yapensis]|uniref:SCP2 sterol-binding domain-containing protein n=2 Tax=Bacillaceae TaxID=186817 RepID=A0A431VZT5_9BACI|nr:SCP2 sterol-binding domain-containing protein [Bacillus yapensis]RTR28780.1 SCP2 sterol-binding domain-containing protein [Bacillus yapensis]TKS94638.1 SCP2 sterol-binding domain-containing protein [Bacillus yapensis]